MSGFGTFLTRRESLYVPLLLVAVTAALYGHTLAVPFYLDDPAVLTNNPLLRDLGVALSKIFSQRGLTNLTYAVNYRLGGWTLAPLHLVNIALHAGCALLVWQLLRQLLPGSRLPLPGALLFLAHPLQTQAVTYLSQRSTVLGALCFLLAMFLYLKARAALAAGQRRGSPGWLWPYLGAVVAGACAVLAKENTATLSLVLIAYDRLFPGAGGNDLRPRLRDALPFFLMPLLLAGLSVYQLATSGDGVALGSELVSLRHNSPLHYLVTQLSVLWIYLRFLLLPYGQALLHNYPVVAELVTWQNGLALAGWLGVGGLVWQVRRRRPLLAFGVAWFFLTLLVESSVIPLDPLFEHRLYLPMFGFTLVLLDGLPAMFGEQRSLLVFGLMLLVCLPLTWRRNALWQEPLAFYQDNLHVAPDSERVLEYLAMAKGRAGDFQGALTHLRRAVAINPNDASVYTNLGVIHAWMGEDRQAADYFEQSLKLAPASEETLFNYAATLFSLGDRQKTFTVLRTVVRHFPDNADAQYGLGTLVLEFGHRDEAVVARDALRRLGDARADELDQLLKAAAAKENR